MRANIVLIRHTDGFTLQLIGSAGNIGWRFERVFRAANAQSRIRVNGTGEKVGRFVHVDPRPINGHLFHVLVQLFGPPPARHRMRKVGKYRCLGIPDL